MLSLKLVQMIERHADGLAEGVARAIRNDPRTTGMARLPEAALRVQCQEFLKHLDHWLVESRESEIAQHYEELGRIRLGEGIPLPETVHALHVLKRTMLDHVRAQGFAQTAAEVYGEEELEHEIGRFFDSAVYHVVRGFEAGRLRHVS